MIATNPQASLNSDHVPQTGAKAGAAAELAPEFVINVAAQAGDTLASIFGRLEATLKDRGATLLKLMVFGPVAAREEGIKAMRRYLGAIDWPVTWVEGAPVDGTVIAGVQAWAVEGVHPELQRVVVGGRVVASVYEDGAARHCLLGGLGPTDPRATPATQANQTFENLEKALETAGFNIADLARTWFYNDDILAWYGDFNSVRTTYYSRRPFRTGSVPASTAVSGRSPYGAALSLAAWAVIPLDPNATVQEIASPLQCPAPKYGSSFARAMEIVSGGSQRLLVSGTASIEPGGLTVHLGDARRQIELSMQVVEAILVSRELTFNDVTRALAYCKDPSYAPLFRSWLATRGYKDFPYTPVHCDICRDDLLFEVELDAVAEV